MTDIPIFHRTPEDPSRHTPDLEFIGHAITDDFSETTFTPVLCNATGIVGFKCERAGRTEYIYLNPTDQSDDGKPNVFLYQGPTGDPVWDTPQHFYPIDEDPNA